MSTGIVQEVQNVPKPQDPYFKSSVAVTAMLGFLYLALIVAGIIVIVILDIVVIANLSVGYILIFIGWLIGCLQSFYISNLPIIKLIQNKYHYNDILPQMRNQLPTVDVKLSNEHQTIDVQTNTSLSQAVQTQQKTKFLGNTSQKTTATNSASVSVKIQNKTVSTNVMLQKANIDQFYDCTAPIIHDFNQSNLLLCTQQLVLEYTPKNKDQIHQQMKFLFNEYHYIDHFAVCSESITFPHFQPTFIIHNGQQKLRWYQKKYLILSFGIFGLCSIPLSKLQKEMPRQHIVIRKISSEVPVQSDPAIIIPHAGYQGKLKIANNLSVEPKQTPITMEIAL
ncbi:Hypothetical_protein [Hexamita inflata]|uniref:Hypothetical_protein n=1 Tax=Hexamita inflata TaxID=28002 RepID=A0AA86R6Q4_9EUKA|nr:Hypothetical protein HINF_LOCUS55871 [Hexamita inflata]